MLKNYSILRNYKLVEYCQHINNVRWSYLRGGSGETVIFLHPAGGSKYNWGSRIYKLRQQSDIILVDMPGHGKTKIDKNIKLTALIQANMVIDLLDTLKVNKISLVGASIGGYISALIVLQRPEMINKLILLSPVGISGLEITPAFTRLTSPDDYLFSYKTIGDLDAFHKVIFKNPPHIPFLIKLYLLRKNKRFIKTNASVKNAFDMSDLSYLNQHLTRLPKNTLIIWGKEDKLLHVSTVKNIGYIAPHVKTTIIEECGHLPYLEKPKETCKAIKDFLF